MTDPNNQAPTDTQNEKMIDSLTNEIADLKSALKKKDDRLATLDVMLKQIMETHTIQHREYEDLEDKLKDVIEKLKERVPHSAILEWLKVRDRDPLG